MKISTFVSKLPNKITLNSAHERPMMLGFLHELAETETYLTWHSLDGVAFGCVDRYNFTDQYLRLIAFDCDLFFER